MFIFYFLIFLLLIFFSIYAIGIFFVKIFRQRDLSAEETITLALALGVVLFVITAVALSFLHLRFLFLPILIALNIFNVLRFKKLIINDWIIFFRNKLLLLLILLGILAQGFINFPSGMNFGDGLYFWSSQGHDGLWHVASIEEIKKSIPPQNPGFAGESLYNYHYLVDVLMGEFGRIFPFFSSLDLYFRFFPVLFSFMIGLSVFSLVTRWRGKVQVGYWAIFFTYFVGSFGYVVTLLKNGNLIGSETIFWAAQQHTIIGNPPHAISHGLLASFLLSFLLFTKTRNIFSFIASFLVASVLAGFKVSGGLVLLVGLGFAAVVDFLTLRKYSTLFLLMLLGASNFATFKLLTAKGAEANLMYLPWWFIRTMIVDKLGWIDWEHKRQHYLSKGTWHAYLRVLQLESYAFLIFVIGNLGIRAIGFVEMLKGIIKKRIYSNTFEVMLLTIMLTGLIVPIFFVQRGIIYNNIQFMQYFLFIFGFYGAIATYRLISFLKTKLFKLTICLVIILLSIPTVIGVLVEFYGPGRTALSKISNQELDALRYLKDNTQPNDSILTMPFNPYLKDKFSAQPLPIYAWYDTPYVSAISTRVSYLASEHVTLLGYPQTEERLSNKKRFFEQTDYLWNRNFLKETGIDYIYINKGELENTLNIDKNNLGIFFENNEVLIYKVKESEQS